MKRMLKIILGSLILFIGTFLAFFGIYPLTLIIIPISFLILPFYEDILKKHNKKLSTKKKLLLTFIFINLPILLFTIININTLNELKAILYIIINILLILLTFFLTYLFSTNKNKKIKKRYILIIIISSLLITYINLKGLIVTAFNSYFIQYFNNNKISIKYKEINLNNNDNNTDYYTYFNLSLKNTFNDYTIIETIGDNIKFENKDTKNIILLSKNDDYLKSMQNEYNIFKNIDSFLKKNNISDEIELYKFFEKEKNRKLKITDSLITLVYKITLIPAITNNAETLIVNNDKYNILIQHIEKITIISFKEKNDNTIYNIWLANKNEQKTFNNEFIYDLVSTLSIK